MNIKFHPSYKKAYQKRILTNKKLDVRAVERIKLFKENPLNPILKDHQLVGEKSSFRAFSITGDIRIVYLPVSEDEVIFLNIGSHNQVY